MSPSNEEADIYGLSSDIFQSPISINSLDPAALSLERTGFEKLPLARIDYPRFTTGRHDAVFCVSCRRRWLRIPQ